MNKKMNNILKYGSCFAVFVLPIIYFNNFIYPHISSKTFFFYGLVEILSVFWIYMLITDSSYRLSKKTWLFFMPMGVYLVWMTIAGILAINPALSFWSSLGRGTGLLTLYHCFAFVLIIASLIKRNGIDYLHKLLKCFIYGGFILALSVWFGSSAFNLHYDFLMKDNGGGLMGNSSLAAAYLLFILAFSFFIIFSKNISKKGKWWIGTMLGVIIFSPLFLSLYSLFSAQGLLGSARGATLGIVVMLWVAILIYWAFSKKQIIKIFGIVGIVLSLFVFSISWGQLIRPNTTLHQKFIESASDTRFIFWDISQKSISQHPWFGYGPENYMIAFQHNFNPKITVTNDYKDNHNREGWNDRAHNIYYDTGVSGGYPAIIFYSLFIFSILYGLYRLRDYDVFNRMQFAILGGLIFGYIFQNLFVFDSLLSIMSLFVLAGIVFVFQENINKKEKYDPIRNISPLSKNMILLGLSATCLISLIFFVYMPAKKTAVYYKIVTMPINTRGNYYKDLINGSEIGEQWDVSEIAYNIYGSYITNLANVKNDKTILPYAEKDITSLLQYLEILSPKNTTDNRLNLSMAYLYNILNYLEDKPYDPILAKHLFDILDRAQSLSPADPQVYKSRAQVYAWSGDNADVAEEYKKIINLDPSISESHQLLIKFAQATGNQKLYNDSLLEAQKDIPGFVLK